MVFHKGSFSYTVMLCMHITIQNSYGESVFNMLDSLRHIAGVQGNLTTVLSGLIKY